MPSSSPSGEDQPVARRVRWGENDLSHISTPTSPSIDTSGGSAFAQPGYFKPFPTRSPGPRLRRTPAGLGDREQQHVHPGFQLGRSRLAAALEKEEEERRKREAREDEEVRRAAETRRDDGIVRPRTAQDWHLLAHKHADVLRTGTYGLALSMGTTTAGYDSLVVGVLPEAAPAGMRNVVLRLGQAVEDTGRQLCAQIEAEVAASRGGREQEEP